MRQRRTIIIAGAIVIVALLALGVAVNVAVDALWFREVGYEAVFWKMLWAKLAVRGVVALIIFAYFFVNLRVAATSFGSIRRRIGNIEIHEEIPPKWLSLAAVVGAAFLAFLFSAAIGGRWLDVLTFIERSSFGLVEPLHGRDVAFYIFTLPVLRLVQNLIFLLLVAALVILTIVYITSGGLEIAENRIRFRERPLRHLAINVALLFLVLAWGYRLDIFDLVYSSRGVVFGASYTDVHAQLLGYRVLVALALAGFGVAVWDVIRGSYRMTATAFGALILGLIVFKGVYPGVVQRFEVEPNEIEKEAPYIARNIAYTRRAFDLVDVVERPFEVDREPAVASLSEAEPTIRSVRLWDWRPLLDSYSQLQEIRLYYEFEDVDVDRYDLGSGPSQVMLAAREMAVEQLAEPIRTWQNVHLIYTHGYGFVMSPVNSVTEEGLPMFFVSDIPPRVPDSLAGAIEIVRPEIYYGERTADYVLASTRVQEFDYPRGDENIYTSYGGRGGISVASWWRRALFAWHFGSLKLLLTDAITSDSRLLLYRRIHDRVRRVAPFLQYDGDPYLVLLDGRLLWVQDAYTASDRYPYSQPVEGFNRRPINYVRNSVKVVIDAYHGDVTLYAWEPNDPLLRTYSRIFPSLFRPRSEIPPDLLAHMRYPEGLFSIQAEVLRSYHMRDPKVFYNREDLWNVPNEIYQGQSQPMVPYYVLLRLPDDQALTFQLVLPFTPSRRDNMIALLAAKSDPWNYGQRVIYEFPKDRLIYGPMQVEARIDQDPLISEQITLWSQKGSSVIRGSLLVIPLGNSVLYVEPLFLQAQQSQLPQLTRVIATYGQQIVMEPTLEDAMMALIRGTPGSRRTRAEAGEVVGEAPSVEREPGAPVDEGAAPAAAGLESLTREANAAYDRAVQAQRRGDWAAYGEALAELGRILDRMSEQ
jgi:uncharacterized membrane protein (UPF0182 family)